MKKRHLLYQILIIVGLCTLALAGWAWLFADLPNPSALPERYSAASLRITDRSGRLLYESLPAETGRHIPLLFKEIPTCLVQATIATEDANYYSHPGVDWQGILRALWIDLRGGQTLAGGSTITQQVVRLLLLDPSERYEPTLRRKLREAYLAWRLNNDFSKDEVLAIYLNQSYYGSLAYGVEAAAQTYFGKPASALDLAECSLVAGLTQAPALYSPFLDPAAAQARQSVVLGLMQEQDYITAEQADLARREVLIYADSPYPMEAPHFVLWVLAQIDGLNLPELQDKKRALTVRTSLNLDWQKLAETAIARQLADLQNTPDGLGHNVKSAALVALNPRTGEILSMVGSPDYHNDQNAGAINMALAPRQPGSALKPFIYAAAFSSSQSATWTPATMLLDVQTSFITHDGQAYTPANYDQLEHGPVLAREALASSLNIPAVLTLQHIGVEPFLQFAARLGLDSFGDPGQYDLSLALGGGEVRLLDLTAAYAVLAAQGQRVDPVSILDISDQTGYALYEHPVVQPEKVLDERVAWLISDILNDNTARTLGFGLNSVLRLDRPAAVKTGTTSNFHDNWTVGYTPELVVGVWAGNPDYTPMNNVSGVTGAAPIWHTFIRQALAGQPENWFERPDGLVQVQVCSRSGGLPTPACPFRKLEWFLQGAQPTGNDTLYHQVTIDLDTGRLATPATPPERQAQRLALDLPAHAQPWARSQGLLLLSEVAPAASAASPTLHLVTPADQGMFKLAPDLPTESQRLKVEAVSNIPLNSLVIYADGHEVARFTTPPYQTWWTLTEGRHTFWAEGVSANDNDTAISSPAITIQVKK